MIKNLWQTMLLAWLCALPAIGVEQTPLSERRFQEKFQALGAERSETERLQRAKEMVSQHWVSSLQVKALAARLGEDSARLEFATVAYSHTVDPENFYEVYDAFSTFSKVMRLHDRIHPAGQPGSLPAVVAPSLVTEEEMQDILRALRKESFDQTRDKIARQILGGSRKPFLAVQIKQMLDCFDFEPNKLELAKYAYDYTLDREKYFVVNEAFTFDNTKTSLSQYVGSRTPPAGPRH